jgi:hypothetical protein
MSELPAKVAQPYERIAFSWDQLRTSGLLWYINRAALHPCGMALGLSYADGVDEPLGWSLTYAGDGEPYYFPPEEEPERCRMVESLFASLREWGSLPVQPGDFPDAPDAQNGAS